MAVVTICSDFGAPQIIPQIALCLFVTKGKIDSWWEAAVWCRELSLGPCDDLEARDEGEGGRPRREGIYLYIEQIHFVVPRK